MEHVTVTFAVETDTHDEACAISERIQEAVAKMCPDIVASVTEDYVEG